MLLVMAHLSEIRGAGPGLKQELIAQIQTEFGRDLTTAIDFLEIAPENRMGAGGRVGKQRAWLAERYPIACHGLSLPWAGLTRSMKLFAPG